MELLFPALPIYQWTHCCIWQVGQWVTPLDRSWYWIGELDTTAKVRG